jgi:hypothetical protein
LTKVITKQKRSETSPERIKASGEAEYAQQEESTAKRTAFRDSNYEDGSSTMSL